MKFTAHHDCPVRKESPLVRPRSSKWDVESTGVFVIQLRRFIVRCPFREEHLAVCRISFFL